MKFKFHYLLGFSYLIHTNSINKLYLQINMKNNTQFITYVNVPHTRGKAELCSICNKKFGVMTREHQCKRLISII